MLENEPDKTTSELALESIEDDAPRIDHGVVEFIRRCGSSGATCHEIEQGLSLRHQTASSAMWRIKRAGRIVGNGERRKTDSGRHADAYVIADGSCGFVQVDEEWKRRYYASRHWQDLRRLRKEYDAFRCCWCHDDEDLHVHHWVYDLFSEYLGDLMTLCADCHSRLHEILKRPNFPRTTTVENDRKLRQPAEQLGLFERS